MRVRALLIVNPQATTTTKPILDFIAASLAAETDLETVETRYRDARDIAAAAAAEGRDALLVLSGDGTINEVVNGLMQAATSRAVLSPLTAAQLPAIAAIPGGNANVFTRDLGVPADPVAAIKVISTRLAAGTTRTIGLGLAGDRYFTFNAGLGWDAEVVRAVEDKRAHGGRASAGLYIRMALRRVLPAHRPASSGPGLGDGGRSCRRAPGHGAGLQHHTLVLRRPPSGQPHAARVVRHRPRRVRAAAAADIFHPQRDAPDAAADGPGADRQARGDPAR